MFKYTDSEDIDPDKLNPVEKSVTLLEVPTEGATQYVKGVPLEVFVDDKAYDSWKRLKPFIDDRDFDSFNKAIANLPPRDYYRDWMVKSAKEIE